MQLDKSAAEGADINLANDGKRRQQRELVSGIAFIAQGHQQRDESRNTHAAAQVLEEDRSGHRPQMLIGYP